MKNNHSNILLSVIIPVFNVRPFLTECLDSVLAQDFKNFEIILINDGSYDGSGRICDAYSRKDPRIQYYRQKNKGLSATRNLGLNQAQGDYIFFLDSDDWLEREDAFSLLLNEAKESNADLVYCYSYIAAKDGKKYENWTNSYLSNNSYSSINDKKDLLYPCICWIKLYRKDFIENNKIRFLENVYYEDNPWNMETLFYSRNIVVIKEYLINYRVRHDSITKYKNHTFSVQNHYNLVTAHEMDFFDNHKDSEWLPYLRIYWIHQSLIHYFMIDDAERQLFFYEMKRNIKRIHSRHTGCLKNRFKSFAIKRLPHFLFKRMIKSSYMKDL